MAAARKSAAPAKTGRRFLLILLVLLIAAGGAAVAVDKNMLPQSLQGNALVARFYRVREALLNPNAAPVKEDPAAKQLGYPKDDRKKLDALIDTGEPKQ